MHFCLKKTLNREGEIVFALPKTNQYQQISQLKINPSPNMTILDEWGNETIILNDVKSFSLKFNYQGRIFAVPKTKLQSFSIGDYQKLNKETLSFYTQPNRFLHPHHPKIYQLAKKIIGKEKNLLKILEKLYQFILDYLIYDNPIDGLYRDLEALERKRVDCGGFSTLFLSLLHSLKIPGRLVVGFLIKENLFTRLFNFEPFTFSFDFLMIHAWPEILLPDASWFPCDPSIEWKRTHGLSKRQGGFGFVPSDRLVVSYGCDLKYQIGKKTIQIDIIQKPYDLN